MGCCESTANTQSKTGSHQKNIQNEQSEQITRNHPLNMEETRVEEAIVQNPNEPFIELNPKTSEVLSKKICRILIETKEKKIIGIGFILAFNIDLEWFYCLMTNDHLINNESINNNNTIYISFEEFKTTNLILDRNKRYIKSFRDEKLDITVVEILDEDNISKNNYLEPELDIPVNNKLKNKEIYIPQYIEGMKLLNAEGSIKDIDKYEFSHLANTKQGSSGSPIFLKNSNKVIGIHKSGAPYIKINYGDFIYPVINLIKEDIRKRRNDGKYINGKFIYDDGKYYIGEYKNNIPNGKGIKYYKNGKILYDGNFINGKFEGNGKYIWEYGTYYIGQWKNGLRHGKGTDYYSDGKIMYEGDWVNNKREGNGKLIWKDGAYYIGQFKNGLRIGKGTIYYSNGDKYEGDFVNGKREGNGKYIWKDGGYYIGQYKNGLKNGKGTDYYSDGKIKYEGDFVNDKFEGNGKYIWKNGEYYIGQFKNGLKNGKGTMYNSNGDKYEGDIVDDKKEGNGKYIYKDGHYYIGQYKNDLRNGKGTLYNSNGDIKLKGNWINDEFVES